MCGWLVGWLAGGNDERNDCSYNKLLEGSQVSTWNRRVATLESQVEKKSKSLLGLMGGWGVA